jgi:hypothetical protein
MAFHDLACGRAWLERILVAIAGNAVHRDGAPLRNCRPRHLQRLSAMRIKTG